MRRAPNSGDSLRGVDFDVEPVDEANVDGGVGNCGKAVEVQGQRRGRLDLRVAEAIGTVRDLAADERAVALRIQVIAFEQEKFEGVRLRRAGHPGRAVSITRYLVRSLPTAAIIDHPISGRAHFGIEIRKTGKSSGPDHGERLIAVERIKPNSRHTAF